MIGLGPDMVWLWTILPIACGALYAACFGASSDLHRKKLNASSRRIGDMSERVKGICSCGWSPPSSKSVVGMAAVSCRVTKVYSVMPLDLGLSAVVNGVLVSTWGQKRVGEALVQGQRDALGSEILIET